MASRRERDLDPINLTPLLDCILNLIFFFLLATTIKENVKVMQVNLPTAATAMNAPIVKEEIIVTIADSGAIYFGNDEMTTATLKLHLAELVKQPGEKAPVRIRSDRNSRVQALYDVVSIFQQSGYPNFHWETKSLPSKP